MIDWWRSTQVCEKTTSCYKYTQYVNRCKGCIIFAVSPYSTSYNYKAYRYDPGTNVWTVIPDIPLMNGTFSRPVGEHVWTGTAMLQPTQLNLVNDRFILWSYSRLANNWTAMARVYSRRGIQGGATTVMNENSTFYRYDAGGYSPSYGSIGKALYYYQKK